VGVDGTITGGVRVVASNAAGGSAGVNTGVP